MTNAPDPSTTLIAIAIIGCGFVFYLVIKAFINAASTKDDRDEMREQSEALSAIYGHDYDWWNRSDNDDFRVPDDLSEDGKQSL